MSKQVIKPPRSNQACPICGAAAGVEHDKSCPFHPHAPNPRDPVTFHYA